MRNIKGASGELRELLNKLKKKQLFRGLEDVQALVNAKLIDGTLK
jgi:hypothetical protein